MSMAMQRYANRLKERFYSLSYAICADIYRFLSRLQRRLRAIDETTTSRSMKFVVVKVCIPLIKLTDLFFQVAFAFGQRKLLLLERKTLALDVHEPIVHITDDLIDQTVVTSLKCSLGDVRSGPERRERAGKR